MRMNKQDGKKWVPRLRFPEFAGNGQWVKQELGEIAVFVNEKTALNSLSINSYISTENLLPDYAGVSLSLKLPSSGNFTKYQKGDVLISNIRPYLKKVWLADKDGACSNDVIVIRAKYFVSDKFLSFLLKNDFFINYMMKGAEGVKMPRGDKDSIRLFSIIYPKDQSEQQKIAVCLSSLDKVITAERQKLELLKEHKKGLLQNLFPQEGETAPRLRFGAFKESGAWEEKRLGEILLDGKLGGNYENSNALTGIPVIKMGNLERGKMNVEKLQFLPDGLEYDKKDVLKEGDLLLNTRNTLELVGKVAIWNNELPLAVFNSNLLRLTFNETLVESNYFMNYNFNTDRSLKEIRKIATGTTSVAAIYTKDLLTLKVVLPSLKEQQKIATCLTSLDNLINAQTQKIETLKLHKKGLLQGLFPDVNALNE